MGLRVQQGVPGVRVDGAGLVEQPQGVGVGSSGVGHGRILPRLAPARAAGDMLLKKAAQDKTPL
jgi:hypothetical protein